ncbi:hypothetical protein [Deinococcus sp. A31D244]|uniref:hypothetical protein n=1 Tax=Deinococcus sp. A31D244 TaxID=3397675 RepID=UPI0039E0DB83
MQRLKVRPITLHANITAHEPSEDDRVPGESKNLFIPAQDEGNRDPDILPTPDEDDSFRLEGDFVKVFGTYLTFTTDIKHTSVHVNSVAIDRTDLLEIIGQPADTQD